MDIKQVQELLVNNQIDWLIHLSALLSAVGRLIKPHISLFIIVYILGERDVPLAMKLNIEGTHHILELARKYKCRLFIPSTIGRLFQSSSSCKSNKFYFKVHLDLILHEIQHLIFVFNVLEQFMVYQKFMLNYSANIFSIDMVLIFDVYVFRVLFLLILNPVVAQQVYFSFLHFSSFLFLFH